MNTTRARLAELRRLKRAGKIRDLHHRDAVTQQHGAAFVYQRRVRGGWSPRLTAEGRAS